MAQPNEEKVETFNEKHLREQLERESTPMMLTNIFVRGPQWCLLAAFFALMYMTQVSMKGGMFNLEEQSGRDFLVWTDPKVKADDMRNIAREYINDNADVQITEDGEDEEVAIRSKLAGQWGMIWIF